MTAHLTATRPTRRWTAAALPAAALALLAALGSAFGAGPAAAGSARAAGVTPAIAALHGPAGDGRAVGRAHPAGSPGARWAGPDPVDGRLGSGPAWRLAPGALADRADDAGPTRSAPTSTARAPPTEE